jgi:hypothetical protein
MKLTALTVAALAFAGSALATTVTIDLGPSAENYVLYGQGAYAPGLGSFTNQQGDEVYDAGMNTTTDTLTGAIAGSSAASLSSGTYAVVTTYKGSPIGAGGAEIQSISNAGSPNYFNYSSLDPSVDITAYLYTPGGTVAIPLFTNSVYDGNSFSFSFTNSACTGVAVCDQNNVGLTPGATEYSPTTIFISYNVVPEPAAWSLMLLGFGGLGGMLRSRRLSVRAEA